jgi:hypothetical protein
MPRTVVMSSCVCRRWKATEELFQTWLQTFIGSVPGLREGSYLKKHRGHCPRGQHPRCLGEKIIRCEAITPVLPRVLLRQYANPPCR